MYLSLHPRLTKTLNANPGAVVQLVRMPACHAGGRGFEPLPHRTNKVHPFGSDLICFLCLKEPSTSAPRGGSRQRRQGVHGRSLARQRGFEPIPRFVFIEGRTPQTPPPDRNPSTSAILFHIRLFQTSQFLGQLERFGQFLRPTSQFLGQRERFWRFLRSSPRRRAGTRTFSALFALVPRADGGPSDRTGNNRPARRANS